MQRGSFNTGFKRRFFVLKGNLLYYFKFHSDTVPIGVIILEGSGVVLFALLPRRCLPQNIIPRPSRNLATWITGCHAEALAQSSDSANYEFALVFDGDSTRDYVLATETEHEMVAWMNVLSKVSSDSILDLLREICAILLINVMSWFVIFRQAMHSC